ncbi:MAG: toll/interleukin-1 receptor domain-containing protein [Novosphingobium sp.]
MARPGAAPVAARYRAFISYSHADDGFAHWLHRRLERFALPAAPGEPAGRLAPVFLDRAELAAGTDLSEQVRSALEASAALIVVCSPAAAQSRWVALEIALFRELHPDRPVLAALIAGEPDEAFPAPLTRRGDTVVEPLAADFRKLGDGRRLGLLKVIAGLTALPLDRLVQRDAMARQRRVMFVTAGVLALSLVLAGMLLVALRERAEAQRQRADAEGMVEFMLTDLRDRLKSVGRLDVMAAVNAKAMDHYAGEKDLSGLPADTLERRARLLIAMGEDDIDTRRLGDAAQKFGEAYRISADLLRREPDNPARIFNHAQSEYWVGNLPFLANNKAAAQPHWEAYLRLAERLQSIDPRNTDWRREVAYAHDNLCALAQVEPAEIGRAINHCRKSVEITSAVAAQLPGLMQAQLDNSNDIAWLADAQLKAGNGAEALTLRARQKQLVDALPARFPDDVRAQEARLMAGIGMGLTQVALGRYDEARATVRATMPIADELRAHDPANVTWNRWRTMLMNISKAGAGQAGINRRADK